MVARSACSLATAWMTTGGGGGRGAATATTKGCRRRWRHGARSVRRQLHANRCPGGVGRRRTVVAAAAFRSAAMLIAAVCACVPPARRYVAYSDACVRACVRRRQRRRQTETLALGRSRRPRRPDMTAAAQRVRARYNGRVPCRANQFARPSSRERALPACTRDGDPHTNKTVQVEYKRRRLLLHAR